MTIGLAMTLSTRLSSRHERILVRETGDSPMARDAMKMYKASMEAGMALLAIMSFMQFLKGWSRDTSCNGLFCGIC